MRRIIESTLRPGQTGSYADAINAIRKYVFSSTLTETSWSNSTIVSGDVPTEVRRMKELELTGTRTLGTGVIALRYRPAGG